jgi:hypothetical protein
VIGGLKLKTASAVVVAMLKMLVFAYL